MLLVVIAIVPVATINDGLIQEKDIEVVQNDECIMIIIFIVKIAFRCKRKSSEKIFGHYRSDHDGRKNAERTLCVLRFLRKYLRMKEVREQV